MSDTPRTDAIRIELHKKYTGDFSETRRFRYYMEAAECYGQESAIQEERANKAERELAACRKELEEAKLEIEAAHRIVGEGERLAPRESEEGLGYWLIGQSFVDQEGSHPEILWLSSFEGGTSCGTWTNDNQKGMEFIHKRDADSVMTLEGIAVRKPFVQWFRSSSGRT